jgi:hypothetical protein
MKSYRKNMRKNKKSRKNKKGGFFFGSKPTVAPSAECDPNNLVNIQDSTEMHSNYQKCCPKGVFGKKNSSPYCRQLDLNFQAALKSENDALGYAGMSMDKAQSFEQMPISNNPLSQTPKKPWWKFWGGKTRRIGKKGSKRRH